MFVMLAKMVSFLQLAAEKIEVILASITNKYSTLLISLGIYYISNLGCKRITEKNQYVFLFTSKTFSLLKPEKSWIQPKNHLVFPVILFCI